jgi:hypothetical protein
MRELIVIRYLLSGRGPLSPAVADLGLVRRQSQTTHETALVARRDMNDPVGNNRSDNCLEKRLCIAPPLVLA